MGAILSTATQLIPSIDAIITFVALQGWQNANPVNSLKIV